MLDKLIKKFINGEASAFDEIYALTRKSVYFTALSVLRDDSLAEDVMQTTYLKLLKNIRDYTFGTNASAWLIKISKNEALNLKKQRAREQPVDERENLDMFGSAEQNSGGIIDLAKRILSDDEFTLLSLCAICGYKRREVAKMLELPISTVTWKYQNAIAKIRKSMQEEGE